MANDSYKDTTRELGIGIEDLLVFERHHIRDHGAWSSPYNDVILIRLSYEEKHETAFAYFLEGEKVNFDRGARIRNIHLLFRECSDDCCTIVHRYGSDGHDG